MKHTALFAVLALLGITRSSQSAPPPDSSNSSTLVIDFAGTHDHPAPCVGFLGGLRDDTPDALVEPLHPTLWRIGHQFRGRIAGGLPAAIARVRKFGAVYKLVMSDLVNSHPQDWSVYEADVRKLVGQAGESAPDVIWEVANEPDVSYKPIDQYYELYAHAFHVLRAINPSLQICGPSFAFPTYEKYKAFLDYCKENQLECNDLSWHYTGWDPDAPRQQKWQLENLPLLIKEYPGQHIKEIHCDEWGAGPEKPSATNPGRLQPGRAVIWFHYLQDIYQVDRACRANWGKADDYLGGIISTASAPYPAYYAYRFYGSMAGLHWAHVEGNDRAVAALAAAGPNSYEVLLGSVAPRTQSITLELHAPGIERQSFQVQVLPGTNLDQPMTLDQVPATKEYKLQQQPGVVSITLSHVEENQAYRIHSP